MRKTKINEHEAKEQEGTAFLCFFRKYVERKIIEEREAAKRAAERLVELRRQRDKYNNVIIGTYT